jgi:hypothetical protein
MHDDVRLLAAVKYSEYFVFVLKLQTSNYRTPKNVLRVMIIIASSSSSSPKTSYYYNYNLIESVHYSTVVLRVEDIQYTLVRIYLSPSQQQMAFKACTRVVHGIQDGNIYYSKLEVI